MEGYRILKHNWTIPSAWDIDVYRKQCTFGYETARKVVTTMEPSAVRETVKQAGLRGRGGAGFPAGVKWGFVPKNASKPTYLINNADEGEPGTFKDRYIMERDPHQMIEGMIIAGFALQAPQAYIYIRGELGLAARRVQNAIDQAYAAGFLGKGIFGTGYSLEMTVHRGAGAYVCGEETGLISSIEGKKGNPRLKPPFPAVVGAFGAPSIVNNTETLTSIPYILEHGVEAYRTFGTEKSPGTKLFTVSGHVEKPGVYELPLGFPLKKLLYDVCGGIRGGHKLKAVIPGGSSAPVLTADEAERANLDYESLMEVGSMLGSGGVIVMDDTTDMVWALKNLTHFYAHESCGQCTPCREGTRWLDDIVTRFYENRATEEDFDRLLDICDSMSGTTICALSDAAVFPVKSFITKFRDEFEKHTVHGTGG